MLKTQTRRVMVAALLGSSMLVPAAAFAQDAAEDANDEIIVTAQKREESLQNVPMSIQAIGTEKLDQLQVQEFADYVKFLPSVTIQTSAPGFAQVFFRAVASGENANHSTSQPTVGMYLDEQPITTIQGALDIHVYDMARVEALAGPQGTLYGASSMAGTIKLVTNKPDTKGFYGEMGGQLNIVSHGRMGGTYEGFVNAPISDTIAVRAVGWYRRDGGYIDNIAETRTYPIKKFVPDTSTADPDDEILVDLAGDDIAQSNDALAKEDYNDAKTYGGRIALGIDLNDSWTITPSLMGQVQKTNGSYAQERGLKYETIQYNPEGSNDKWWNAGLTIQGKLGNWDLTYAGGFLKRRTKVESDYSDYSYFYDAISGYATAFYDNSDAQVSPNQYIQGTDRYKKYFQEFRISSPSDKRLRVMAGLFWQRQSHNIEQNYIIDDIADSITVTGTDSSIWLTQQQRTDRDQAAFGEVYFDVTDKLTLTGGIRAYKYKNSLQGFFGYSAGYSSDKYDEVTGAFIKDGTGEAACNGRAAIVPGSPCTNVDKTTSDTDFIHKLNATYKFNDDALIYATWSSGFRPGGVNRRGTLPPYLSDQIDNYELGWKTSFGRVRFNGAIYQLDWNDIQLSFLGANGLSEVRNAGIARIRGAEADISYRQGGLSLSAGISYNQAEIRKDFCKIANATFNCALASADGTDNALLAPAGSRLPVTPKVKGNAVARYEFPLAAWEGHIQIAGSHVSGRRSDLRTTENGLKGNLKAYSTVDLSFGIKDAMWTGELFATNLLNSGGLINTGIQCIEAVCGDADGVTNSGGVFYDTVIRPRVIGIKVARKF